MVEIICIDPGTTVSGAVWWSVDDMQMVEGHVMETECLLNRLQIAHPSKMVFIEKPSAMGMPLGHDMIETLINIGRFQDRAEHFKCVRRIDIKKALLGKTCGNDAMVNARVRQIIAEHHGITEKDIKGTKANPGPCYGAKSHMWPAIAMAICVCKGLLDPGS